MRTTTIGALVLALWLLGSAPASAQAGCRFTLGFAAIRELIGAETVGDCLEDEHHNPENGDGLQRTIGGLLVWRKADNWTAFTDGHRTWVNGPRGLQRRLNTERFDWEGAADAAPAAGGASAPAAVAAAARAAAAPRLGVAPADVALTRVEAVDWPDTALGCREPGRAYAQVITPGYRLTAGANGRTVEVHADERGRAVSCG